MPFQLNSLMIARYIGNSGHWWCGCNDVLIDLMGASCNVMGQQTWELLKQRGIKCESRKSAKELFAYGGIEPLLTLGTFTADVTKAGFKSGSQVDFGVWLKAMVVRFWAMKLPGCQTFCVLVLFRQTVLMVDDRTVMLETNTSTCLVVLVF